MKPSAGFNPRRLRSPSPGRWRRGFCSLFSIVLLCLGLGLLAGAIGGLAGQFAPLTGSLVQAALTLLIGFILVWLGVHLWCRCRNHQHNGGLDLAPHLLKRR